MLDINLFRESPGIVKESQRKRGLDEKVVDAIVKFDKQWREFQQKADELKHQRNVVSEKINELKKAGKPVKAEIELMRSVADEIKNLDEKIAKVKSERDSILMETPNLVDKSVPIGDASANKEIKKWGKLTKFDFAPKGHEEIAGKLGLLDVEKAAKTTGARFYYLKGDLAKLNLAINNFAIDYLRKKGFTLVYPPFMLNRNALQGAITLAAFEEMIYKIEGEDLYLIGTAEHAVNAYHMDDILDEKQLPLRYAGFSTNFRKEAGAHGKDTKGIFRVHQFDKVEQFVFCKPEDAWNEYDLILDNLEKIFQALEIPYRLVILSSQDMGRVPTKTIDLEGWFPVQNAYRELASCSNCLDFQARRANIKYRTGTETKLAFTLNNTAVATPRAIACLLENNQQKDGTVKIPKALWPYTGFEVLKPAQ